MKKNERVTFGLVSALGCIATVLGLVAYKTRAFDAYRQLLEPLPERPPVVHIYFHPEKTNSTKACTRQ